MSILAFPTRARATAVVIERRALAAGAPAALARQFAAKAQRAVRAGEASPAALLARRGTRPTPGPEGA
jgi:hypothetical protein